jgi:O-antigen/teichoic acid export membrane protein
VGMSWALTDQVLSSTANVALTVMAGRMLGPGGLGSIAVGFAMCLAALGFLRSLLIDPLVASSSALEHDERDAQTRSGLTLGLVGAAATSFAALAVGSVIPGYVGHGVLIFAPWAGAFLLLELARVLLFRDNRGRAAAVNSVVRVSVMAASLPLITTSHSEWVISAWWGGPAALGAVLGFWRLSVPMTRPGLAYSWWRSHAWPFARWLSLEAVVSGVGEQATMLLLALQLGAEGLGGLRAVITLFTPLTLIVPAFHVFGLPQLARRLGKSWASARRLATGLCLTGAILTGIYVIPAALAARWLLSTVYGKSFTEYAGAGRAMAAGALVAAGTVGYGIFLRAQRRGRAVLTSSTAASVASLVFAVPLAAVFGVEGAAWGLALGWAVGAFLMASYALVPARAPAEPRYPRTGVGDLQERRPSVRR